ncbi:MAG: pyridoxal-phosphate-dependent aminotransferase family protein [Candidatus Dormibacteria bacterium]
MTLTAHSPLLLIPGPTPVPQPVLEALARPTESHTSPTTGRALRRLQEGIEHAVGATPSSEADGSLVFVLAGSGTMALEVGIVNLILPGEKLLVVSQGFFGARFAAVGRAIGADVVEVSCPWGEQVAPAEVERALRESGARVMTVTHVDTATGVVAPFLEYARIARDLGVVMVLDAVAGVGGMPVEMADAGIDVVITASQKALGLPPGLAIVAVSHRALEMRRKLGHCGSYFMDWLNWEAPMRDCEAHYFATLPTNMVVAGAAAIDLAESEGWEPRFARHRRMARSVRRGLRALGLAPMGAEDVLSATVTAARVPEGIDPNALRGAVAMDQVAIAGGIGAWNKTTIRLGHMGATGLPELLQGMAALESGLIRVGAPVERGAGVAELVCGWEEDLAG